MVLTLDVLLHEADEKNFKIKIKSALVRSSTQEYLFKKILQYKSILFLSSLLQNHWQNSE